MPESRQSNDSTTGILETARRYGKSEERISIDISFRIIRQFSKQLYDNPRRAIEELVCNSYDANATECHIHTPESTDDALYVLDNGHSMDMEGLRWLWKVASSRKVEEYNEQRENGNRQQIGKFGVGKLASFALGSRLTYVATKDGKTRVVSVHQDRLKEEATDDEFTVHEFPADEAEERIGQHFEHIPDPWEKDWQNWTLAVVEEIPDENTGNDLQPWHLKNMIRTAIPTSSDFQPYLNSKEISSREPHGEEVIRIDMTEDEMVDRIKNSLKSYWAQKQDIKTENVNKDKYQVEVTTFPNPKNTDEEIAGIEVPELGKVAGTARYFDRPLTTDKRREKGFQDHGFRVRVLGKLINKSDPLFGLEPLSFTTWAHFLGEFEMPGLDDVVRVQRDQVKDEAKTHIARRILKASFNETRKRKKQLDKEEESAEMGVVSSESNGKKDKINTSFSERLQKRSQQYAYDSISGLQKDLSKDDLNLDEIDIQTRPLKPTDRAVEFDLEEQSIVVNEEHPLIDTLRRTDEFTQNIEDAFKEILAARLLIYGYLRKSGADGMALAASRQIFDSVLRSAAGNLGADELDYQLSELDDASTVGGSRFENSIVDIFQNIGLSAAQEGGPDTHDGVIVIPQVGENIRISVEAKGSQGIVSHKHISFDTVNRHRKEQNCDYAVVIAREFQVDGRQDSRSALLRNLDSGVSDEEAEKISLMTTEAIEVFLRLHYEQPFTYSETIDILTNNELPSDIPEFVMNVWERRPDDELTRDILQAAHDFLEQNPTNHPSVGALTANERLHHVAREEISDRLESLDNLTDSIEMKEDGEFIIDAPVDVVLSEVDDSSLSADQALPENQIINTGSN